MVNVVWKMKNIYIWQAVVALALGETKIIHFFYFFIVIGKSFSSHYGIIITYFVIAFNDLFEIEISWTVQFGMSSTSEDFDQLQVSIPGKPGLSFCFVFTFLSFIYIMKNIRILWSFWRVKNKKNLRKIMLNSMQLASWVNKWLQHIKKKFKIFYFVDFLILFW